MGSCASIRMTIGSQCIPMHAPALHILILMVTALIYIRRRVSWRCPSELATSALRPIEAHRRPRRAAELILCVIPPCDPLICRSDPDALVSIVRLRRDLVRQGHKDGVGRRALTVSREDDQIRHFSIRFSIRRRLRENQHAELVRFDEERRFLLLQDAPRGL